MNEKKARFVYLDVEGVLYTGGRWHISGQVLKNLKMLVEGSGCVLVISSSYRCGDWNALRSRLDRQGVLSIIGCTPRAVEDKALSIREDLTHRGDIEFVVIDDGDLDIPHLIKCDPVRGLTKSIAEKAILEFERQGSLDSHEQ